MSVENTLLSQFSDDIANLVEASRAYTVTVFGRRRLPGTGIVWAADRVVTASHVVERDEDIEIGMADGTRHAATVIGRDPSSDLVVLKVEETELTVAPRADVPRPGEIVFAVGRAGVAGPDVSMGIVNTTRIGLRVGRGRIIEPILQSEIAMLPGFSGGPLLNARGEVLGMNSSHLGRAESLTISNAALEPLVEALSLYGKLRRGYIGVGAQAVGLAEAQVSDSGERHEVGLVILSIDQGGPAHEAGLLIGDILVAVDGHAVSSVDDLVDLLPGERIGHTIPVTIVRGSESLAVQITVGERA
ncbi:MAG: S1C family serine protease [Chloroflexota bacterium]|nr:S1C family serine protease [Chloroflexota bacterium]